MKKKRCCLIGLGYIGLPTAILLANNGHDVLGVDINENHIESIKNNSPNIKEPNLNKNLKKALESGLLTIKSKIESSEIYVITVPTPLIKKKETDPKPDINFVVNVANSISKKIKENDLVIIESTCPVGTTEYIADLISKKSGIEKNLINFAYCPERVLPGKIFEELEFNSRVIGGLTNKAALICRDFYSTFCKGELSITDAKTAEMVKLSENCFRDVNIAFANELSMICEKYKINTNSLIKLANLHPRVNILTPGCGVGGHCIAIDPWFLVDSSPEESKLIKTAREVNNQKNKWAILKIKKIAEEFKQKYNKDPSIACLGLSYKPNINDIRESPSKTIVYALKKFGFKLYISDPNLIEFEEYPLVQYKEAINKSDIVVILVAHKEFFGLDLKNKVKIDFSGIFNN